MFTLGLMYANGAGIARDNAAASALFARAAELGHAHAAEILVIIGEEPKVLPSCMFASNSATEEEMDEPDLADGSRDSISDALRDVLGVLSGNKRRVAELVRRVAPSYEIDPRLALALIAVESNFEPLARSVKNARGVMQLTPGTAARFNVEDPWNVQDNVRGGLTYLRWLLAYYEGQVALVLAAYNAGEGAVDKYRGIPPYPETRAYVRRVQRLFGGEQHPYDPSLVLPSPILVHSNAAR
jgi:soluble lytic murein transglycosylase-like protein